MKLVGIMSLKEHRTVVRDLLRSQDVQIYSETEILGHSTESIAKIGWFATGEESPEYSTLCFAIMPDASAEAAFAAIEAFVREHPSDHPLRAFLVPIERMT
jgi:hypothetical protein